MAFVSTALTGAMGLVVTAGAATVVVDAVDALFDSIVVVDAAGIAPKPSMVLLTS